MKILIKKISLILMLVFLSVGCSDFDEINERPDAFSSDEVSAKYFLTGTQIELYAPNRYPYWRAQLIHADRFAGHFTFGHSGSWWNDGLAYSYSSGYTDASYNWAASYVGKLTTYLNFVKEGGDLENERYYAIGLIMKGLYYQMYTDIFGMVPYSEATNPDIITPKFDTQAIIYQGVIGELDQAMQIIGDHINTGEGVDLLTNNDLFFNG
ncbi:MAG: SusD/RagB family nutrient-binding outer membrane lipoprotein, partial [Bacteroidota bacterium]